jgi:uncharacterized protein
MKKLILIAGLVILVISSLIVTFASYSFYINQEEIIFQGQPMPKDFVYAFNNTDGYGDYRGAEENNLTTKDGAIINTALIKSKESKGVVLFLHSYNAKFWNLSTEIMRYVENGYDVLMLDYRGYGKSDGQMTEEINIYNDAQAGYDFLKSRYAENQIVVSGKGLGTAPAAKIAQTNNPKLLVLESPFYSGPDLLFQRTLIVLPAVLKYQFRIDQMLPNVKAPIVIFARVDDLFIPYNSSERLTKFFKPGDKLISMSRNDEGNDTYGFSETFFPNYKKYNEELKKALE